VIDDALWCTAVAALPSWAKARCFASTGTVEIEWDRDELRKPYNDAADARAAFFNTLGGDWELVDRVHRFKSVVCAYKRRVS
jgi:hypothetical protein